jgi:creatinine amidohydrolase/Fe(II)-dependent formamide hydrolase-like protein
MLIEISEDLLKYGATHILFVNGHGRNRGSIRRCRAVLPKACVPVAVTSYWNLTQVVDPNWLATGHADYIEGSLVMAVGERLVQPETAEVPKVRSLRTLSTG